MKTEQTPGECRHYENGVCAAHNYTMCLNMLFSVRNGYQKPNCPDYESKGRNDNEKIKRTMTKEQIELAKRRAWADTRTTGERLTNKEVLDWSSPSDNFNDGFDAGMAFALSHQWVSVEERLPGDDNLVLAHCTNIPGELCYCTAYYKESAWHFPDDWYYGCDVTHWMPIPQLNNEKEE